MAADMIKMIKITSNDKILFILTLLRIFWLFHDKVNEKLVKFNCLSVKLFPTSLNGSIISPIQKVLDIWVVLI